MDRLASQPCSGYGRADSPATEPSALAGMALAAAGQLDPARQVADWLAGLQASDGSVGVRAAETQPCWPTSLAVLTWVALHEYGSSRPYQSLIDRSVHWIVSHQGVTLPRNGKDGHDSTLEAWPWVDETHTWVEPTALHVMALKAIGQGNHPRTREAVRMLINRQLPCGGLNYGNTIVLGRQLRPHLQPTGVALLALAGELAEPKRVQRSLSYLREQLCSSTTTTSLGWSLMALAAFRLLPAGADAWLEAAYRRTLQRDQSRHKLALIALASQKEQSPLVMVPARYQDSGSLQPVGLNSSG